MRQSLGEIFEPPHPALLEAGAGGERLVAYSRFAFWAFISLAPLASAIAGGPKTPPEVWISLAGTGLATVVSLALVLALRAGWSPRHIGVMTVVLDVTLITLTLLAVAAAGRAEIALNSQVAWGVYLLAILASSLRFDVRLCVLAGALAIGQYLLLLFWGAHLWDVEFSGYVLLLQVGRIGLMIAASGIGIGLVFRSQILVNASGVDGLTGLANRAYFEERFAAELSRSRRSDEPLTLALVDLDHFKEFNDRYGHDAGDQALQLVARVMTQGKRRQDFLARWGGEELVLLLPATEIEGGSAVIDRIRESLADQHLVLRGQRASLTMSGGLAEFPKDGHDAAELFRIADRRLYTAKHQGRNRIVAA